ENQEVAGCVSGDHRAQCSHAVDGRCNRSLVGSPVQAHGVGHGAYCDDQVVVGVGRVIERRDVLRTGQRSCATVGVGARNGNGRGYRRASRGGGVRAQGHEHRRNTRGIRHLVNTRAAVHHVGASAFVVGRYTRIVEEHVVIAFGHEQVVASTTVEDVVARVADEGVVAATAVDGVVTGATVNRLVAVTTSDEVAGRATDDDLDIGLDVVSFRRQTVVGSTVDGDG